MDIWYTLGSYAGFAIIIVIAGLIVWSIYSFLKMVKNKLTKRN